MSKKKITPIEENAFYNIGLFNRGQASKIIRKISEDDETALILKNGKPLAVVISMEKHRRLLAQGIDLKDI